MSETIAQPRMEKSSSIQDRKKKALLSAVYSLGCAAAFASLVAATASTEDLLQAWLGVFCVIPGLALVCLACALAWEAAEGWWIICQLKRGRDIQKQSVLELLDGARSVAWTVILLTATVVVIVGAFSATDSLGALFVSLIPGILAYHMGRGALEAFRKVGKLEEIERKEREQHPL